MYVLVLIILTADLNHVLGNSLKYGKLWIEIIDGKVT